MKYLVRNLYYEGHVEVVDKFFTSTSIIYGLPRVGKLCHMNCYGRL